MDKTLGDVDYAEIAEAVYGKPYASDVARRMLYGSRNTLELLDKESVNALTDNEVIDEIESKTRELRAERQKFFDQRRELNKNLTDISRREHLYEILADAANKLPYSLEELFGMVEPVTPGGGDGTEAVLVFSDWHYGLVADNVFNKYDTRVCVDRLRNVIETAVRKIALHKVEHLHVIVLGDLFHGAIHTSARVASEELVCDQLMQVSEILAAALVTLSSAVPAMTVYTTYGNHGRTVQNKSDNIHRDNMERLVPWWLRERLSKYETIDIAPESDCEFLMLNVAGHDICASHGDLDHVGSSSRMLPTLLDRKYDTQIEYIILGDKHHRESFEEMGVTSSICGSLCGVDDFANSKRLFSTPSQLMLIVDPQRGVDAEYRIKCK